ncbi:hypothetical protein F4680DRAFT_421067 [Xylaria scruposa]|nr:hypothetical protein F4680DRAFT_421067 [Xylaria scruposa]
MEVLLTRINDSLIHLLLLSLLEYVSSFEVTEVGTEMRWGNGLDPAFLHPMGDSTWFHCCHRAKLFDTYRMA